MKMEDLYDPRYRGAEKLDSCQIIKATSGNAKVPFCSHTVFINQQNQICYETNWDYRIRIDGIFATDFETFRTMMNFLSEYAKDNEIRKIVFEGKIEEQYAEMLQHYGFVEEKKIGENRFFCFEVKS